MNRVRQRAAISQIAQTTLRAVVGRHTLDETLSETDAINQNIREILDVQTEEWGSQGHGRRAKGHSAA
jgi:regulator of protease activity HflC (stomatin/prohibitin superfamily)